jgi:pimeloyl-ACP methyl ester carboxylesterase
MYLGLAVAAAEYKDGYADSNGVKIHYVTTGSGPLVVMIHGFPDFWYTWRHQMEALSSQYQVAAIDLRGYNLSGKPAGEENYDMRLLIGDVAAVIKHLGREKAIVAGHDWGGAIAWQFAFHMPQMVEKLIVLNLPHPNGLSRELAANEKQKANSAYARNFQKPDSHKALTAERLAGWVTDPAAKAKYIEAFNRSDFNAMMNYYRRNYPKEPYEARVASQRVNVPVLMIHGLKDTALLAPALNNTWDWLDADLTLVTIPNASHFVQQDARELVSKTMKSWLNR